MVWMKLIERALVFLVAGTVDVQAADASGGIGSGSRDRAALVRLVRQDCGSCHGLRLNGGLGPALLPDTLRDKPQESLRHTILLGRPGTAMPPWKGILTEAEVDWILAGLLAGFPEEPRR
jgi:cytochrome c55X